ncbi:hypothetical protein ACF0H5_010421 [Mactra antiquata]
MEFIKMFPTVGFLLVIAASCAYAQESIVSWNLQEEKSENTYIGNVAKKSLLYANVTIEEFQLMKFQILTQGNEYAPLFTIDESASTLTTNAVLDREELCPDLPTCVLSFNVAVYRKDRETEVFDLYKIITVEIILDDINDNIPRFPKKDITIPISENSEVNKAYFINGAFDLDTGLNNSVQTYEMQPLNEMFGLEILHNLDGSTDLNIIVKYPLDRETKSFYQLIIYAKDGGTPMRTGSVNVNITITDQNDNWPVFSRQVYNVTVEENMAINSTVVLVTATDLDSGNNGQVNYRFSSRTSSRILDMFDVNETTGRITTKGLLNFEEKQNWTFKIEAFDHGNPAKTTTVTVFVAVKDINDNYPVINVNLPPGGTKMSEAADKGSFVAHLAVYDEDEGINGEITCNVMNDDFRLEDFKIKNNFKVVLNRPLDYEIQDSYQVSIECKDGGNPPKKNTTNFVVKVEDINDNSPSFLQNVYELSIQEEVFQSIIVQVSAKDLDSGKFGEVTYGLHSDADKRFRINSDTGLITANSKFDREENPFVSFYVLAWDGGEPSLTSTATVNINISDINDNAPIFPSNPIEIRILEGEGGQIANLNVTDPDLGINGEFVLTFPHNDYLDEYFEFDPITGDIKTLKAIDREEVPYFKFWVKATDRGIPQLSSSAEVIVLIVDINDNIPAIMYPNNGNNTKIIPVTSPVGFVVATVQATDKDDGVNAQLLYFIDSGDKRDIFKIDVNSGRITVGREMSGADADAYRLELAVRDNGKTQRTSFAYLNINVQPVNETSLAQIEEESKQNLMLVAIFVAITVVVSIMIIASIIVLRYIDRRNHRRSPPKVNENRFYDIPKVDESMSAGSTVSKDSDVELIKKQSKKEVSFSLDEDSDIANNSTLTNVTSFSTTKPPYLSMDYKSSEDSQSSTMLCNYTSSSDMNKSGLYNEKELSSLTHSQLQNVLRHIVGGNSDRPWLQSVKEEGKHMIKDDTESEASHDTTTSDSGRGGSEDDINSNRAHSFCDTGVKRQYNRTGGDQHRFQNENKLVPRRPPPPIPTDSYPRNISFSDDSVTANTTVATTMCKTPYKQQELFTISGKYSQDTFLETQMTTPGVQYSVADIDTMSEMAVTYRDDASTTTSGSYTINPDDLCNEINELFFKDVIV